MRKLVVTIALSASLFVTACQQDSAPSEKLDPVANVGDARVADDAYELGLKIVLDEVPPGDFSGLHQVYRLGENVISGAEPEGEEALATLASMGVKTIVSVDGKAPDAEVAARLGMRYVHIPIRYSGLTDDQLMQLVKSFRELESPFYVHCFHGKHRGPTAAAVARVVLDGVPRELALAEMRQWCGTSEKYTGLYHDVASRRIPTAAETEAYDWDFPASKPLGGYRQVMIELTRSFDHVKASAGREWANDVAHPDIDVVRESDMVAAYFERALDLAEVKQGPADLSGWARAAAEKSRALHAALVEAREGRASALERASSIQGELNQLCSDCHTSYRNR